MLFADLTQGLDREAIVARSGEHVDAAGLHGGGGIVGEITAFDIAVFALAAGAAAEGEDLIIPVQEHFPRNLGCHHGDGVILKPSVTEQYPTRIAIEDLLRLIPFGGVGRATVRFAEGLATELAFVEGPRSGNYGADVDLDGVASTFCFEHIDVLLHCRESAFLNFFMKKREATITGAASL